MRAVDIDLCAMEFFVLVIFVSFILIVFLKYKKNKKYLKNINGPKPNLFIGNAVDILGNTQNILPVLQDYRQRYGSLVKIYLGPTNLILLVTDVKFLEFVLSSPELIDKAEQYKYVESWLGTGLLTSTGFKWKKRRRMITPCFHFSILTNFIQVFEKNGDVLLQKLEKEIDKNSFDIFPYVNLCTLDIICESAMGISINAQQNAMSDYVCSVKTMSKLAMERTIFPIPDFLYKLTPTYLKEKKLLKVLHGQTDQLIDKKIKERLNNVGNHVQVNESEDVGIKKRMAFLDMLLHSNMDNQNLSRTDIREEVDTFMFAGHDTTSTSISFTLFSIANNSRVQEKIIEEQKQIFDDIKNAKPTLQDLNNMKYLELVIKESLRLYPPFCFLGRQLKKDVEYNGVIYPKNLTLLLFIYDNMRNPQYYPDPLTFKPERFEQPNILNPFIYVPFSAGPRNCIGQKFAMLEMKSILSKILRRYLLIPATPIHNLQVVPDIVLVSKNGVCLSIKDRK